MTDPTIPDPTRRIPRDPHPAALTNAASDTPSPGMRAPEADAEARASLFATHGDPTLTQAAAAPATGKGRAGVEWVRPADLAARAGGRILDRGAELNQRLHDAVRDGIREGRAQLRERLARREAQLEPDATTMTPQRNPLGRTEVSR